MTLAPICLTVYNRVNHFKECIYYLQRCKESSWSTIYISTDAPGRPEDEEAIAQIRAYIPEISGFKKVVPIIHEQNVGSAKAYEVLFELVLKDHNDFIFLEDDVLVSKGFLRFINDGLVKYRYRKDIFSISAFSHSLFYDFPAEKKQDCYFTQRFNPWGFGTWKDRWEAKNMLDYQEIIRLLSDSSFRKKMNDVGIDRLPQLDRLISLGMPIPSDYNIGVYMIKGDMHSLTPYSSKSFNIGNDGSGQHSAKTNRFLRQDVSFLDNDMPYHLPNEVQEQIENGFHYRFNYTKANRIKKLLNTIGLYNWAYQFKGLYRRL